MAASDRVRPNKSFLLRLGSLQENERKKSEKAKEEPILFPGDKFGTASPKKLKLSKAESTPNFFKFDE